MLRAAELPVEQPPPPALGRERAQGSGLGGGAGPAVPGLSQQSPSLCVGFPGVQPGAGKPSGAKSSEIQHLSCVLLPPVQWRNVPGACQVMQGRHWLERSCAAAAGKPGIMGMVTPGHVWWLLQVKVALLVERLGPGSRAGGEGSRGDGQGNTGPVGAGVMGVPALRPHTSTGDQGLEHVFAPEWELSLVLWLLAGVGVEILPALILLMTLPPPHHFAPRRRSQEL